MTRDLHEKIGAVEFEKLFAGLQPPAIVGKGTIAKLGTAATILRGTLLAKGADGKLFVLGSDVDTTGTWSGTGNGTTTVYSLISGGTVPAQVDEVKVDGTALTTGWAYYPETGNLVFDTAPGNSKSIAVKYSTGGGNADCVLTDDIDVGTTSDENVTVYVSGCFNEAALIMDEDYTLTEADRDTLRMKGILLGTVQNP